jgi:alkylhydroperoxidase family enzyme
LARRLGATEEQIRLLGDGDVSLFEPAWRAPLRAAAEMTTGGGRLADDTYRALDADWNAAQIVEIVAVVGLFNYFNRFANALQIPPTK